MTARVLRGVGRDGPVCGSAIASEWDKPGIPYGKTAEQCTREQTWAHYRPPELEPLKRIDEVRFGLGLPNTFDPGRVRGPPGRSARLRAVTPERGVTALSRITCACESENSRN